MVIAIGMLALRCLSMIFIPSLKRLDDESIPAIMRVVPVSLLTNMHLSTSSFPSSYPFLYSHAYTLNLFESQ